MSNGVKIVTAVVVIGLVASAAILFGGNKVEDPDTKTTDNSNASSSVTVTYDGESFSPAEVTVKAGGKVTLTNDSDTEVEPSSDNHPTHTLNPEINFGAIDPGASKTITVTSTGEWEYHNHLSSSQTGIIVVE